MKKTLPPELEDCRVAGPKDGGPFGQFSVLYPENKVRLHIQVVDGRQEEGMPADHPAFLWEHVSVSRKFSPLPPTWEMMCYVKSLFWGRTSG